MSDLIYSITYKGLNMTTLKSRFPSQAAPWGIFAGEKWSITSSLIRHQILFKQPYESLYDECNKPHHFLSDSYNTRLTPWASLRYLWIDAVFRPRNKVVHNCCWGLHRRKGYYFKQARDSGGYTVPDVSNKLKKKLNFEINFPLLLNAWKILP